MRTLYHIWLSPSCRSVRIALTEKKLQYQLRTENTWERRKEFLAINPAGTVPVLIEENGDPISGSSVIFEYLEDKYPDTQLLGIDARERAETRRLINWFELKFDAEVTENLLGEKMMKRFLGLGEPNSQAIRAGCINLQTHLNYISYLTEHRKWIAGNQLTFADISAAAHLSSLDYIGEIRWEDHIHVKTWYSRIKSRPSFKPVLLDTIPGISAPKHYTNLDF